MVEGVDCRNTVDGSATHLKVEGLFVEIGTSPNSDYLKNIVETDEKGRVKVDAINFTSSDSAVFAPGDINNVGKKQIIIASGQGASAALAADDYLKKNAFKTN